MQKFERAYAEPSQPHLLKQKTVTSAMDSTQHTSCDAPSEVASGAPLLNSTARTRALPLRAATSSQYPIESLIDTTTPTTWNELTYAVSNARPRRISLSDHQRVDMTGAVAIQDADQSLIWVRVNQLRHQTNLSKPITLA
jgi:hypothetical protein